MLPPWLLLCALWLSSEEELGVIEGRGVRQTKGVGQGEQGDDTRMKLKVLWQRTGALWFGVVADECDRSVTLTRCQQSLPSLDAHLLLGSGM